MVNTYGDFVLTTAVLTKEKKGKLFIGGFNVPDSSPITTYVTKCLNGQSETLIWGVHS